MQTVLLLLVTRGENVERIVLWHNHNIIEHLLDRGGLTALSTLWGFRAGQTTPTLLDPTLELRGPGSRSNGEMMEM
jgi:hypothetical protein